MKHPKEQFEKIIPVPTFEADRKYRDNAIESCQNIADIMAMRFLDWFLNKGTDIVMQNKGQTEASDLLQQFKSEVYGKE